MADLIPAPEDLARRVASKFRYGGEKPAMLFHECTSTLSSKGTSGMSHGRFSSRSGTPSSALARYAPAAAGGWVGEGAAGGMAGGKKRVAPLLTYHYLPPASSSYNVPVDKKGL